MKRILPFLLLAVALSASGYEAPVTPGPAAVRGVVTYVRPSDRFCFVRSDDGTWWRVASEDPLPLRVGDCIAAEGQILNRTVNRRLDFSRITVLSHQPERVPGYEVVTISELLRHPVYGDGSPDRFAQLVTVAGKVLDINRRLTTVQCIVSDGSHQVGVNFDMADSEPLPEGFVRGAAVRASGTYVYVTEPKYGDFSGISQPLVMLMGVENLDVVSLPPFWTTGRVIAVIAVAMAVVVLLTVWVWFLRRTVARQVTVVENALRDRAVAEGERRERLRLSHDLHDDFQQLLSGSTFRLTAAINWMEKNGLDRAREHLEKARNDLVHTQSQLRAVLWGLKEESEGPGALVELFRYAAGRMAHWQGKVEIVSTGHEPRLARTLAGALLMILQEAVGNALRHGHATKVTVHVDFDGRSLTLRIVDNGIGFSLTDHPPGLGLAGMEERTRALGGRFKILSEIGHGSCVIVEVKV
ncbi:MAG: sensor histidine kinase [Kiritimatiellia bacterium]